MMLSSHETQRRFDAMAMRYEARIRLQTEAISRLLRLRDVADPESAAQQISDFADKLATERGRVARVQDIARSLRQIGREGERIADMIDRALEVPGPPV